MSDLEYWLSSVRDPWSCFSHLAAFIASVFALTHMLQKHPTVSFRSLILAVYGLSLVSLFGASAVYHGPPMPFAAAATLRLVDLSAVSLLIGGTNLACSMAAFNPGLPRSLAMAAIAGITAAGVGSVWLPVALPTSFFMVMYLALGWLGAVSLPGIRKRQGWPAVFLVLCGGLLYSGAGITDGLGWPVIVPNVFGPHEASHLFEILGAGLFHIFVLRYVVKPLEPSEDGDSGSGEALIISLEATTAPPKKLKITG